MQELPDTLFDIMGKSLQVPRRYVPLPWPLTGFPITAESIYLTIEKIDLWKKNADNAFKGITIPF